MHAPILLMACGAHRSSNLHTYLHGPRFQGPADDGSGWDSVAAESDVLQSRVHIGLLGLTHDGNRRLGTVACWGSPTTGIDGLAVSPAEGRLPGSFADGRNLGGQ